MITAIVSFIIGGMLGVLVMGMVAGASRADEMVQKSMEHDNKVPEYNDNLTRRFQELKALGHGQQVYLSTESIRDISYALDWVNVATLEAEAMWDNDPDMED